MRQAQKETAPKLGAVIVVTMRWLRRIGLLLALPLAVMAGKRACGEWLAAWWG